MKKKEAQTSIKIHPLIKQRWSPRAFSEKPVEEEKLTSLFEAARWSASCFNEQPWRFVVGIKGKGSSYQRIFDCLAEGNQLWCQYAPVLILLCAKKTFTHNQKDNKWAFYDLGQAAAYISFQAMAEGLYVHQMAGFDPQKARNAFNIPDDFVPFTVMALGYLGDPDILPDNLKKSELGSRQRIPMKEIVFSENWGQPFIPGI